MKPSGLLTGGSEMDDLSSMNLLRHGSKTPDDIERLETILDGHMRMIQYLENIHDVQYAAYCNLFVQRIEKQILPILEEAIVAAKIMVAMKETLPRMTIENLRRRIQAGNDLPAYDGGDLLDV
jgi:hypothetical protein